ncbi:MAG TPA: DUF5947 family protein [Kofleriaceae bacterium]|nr:DUF5947 family protein [Kofleriaceae bacterium]
MIALRPLAQLARAPRRVATDPTCELCTAPIGERHRHVAEVGTRGILCACGACAILFARSERGARFRTVPDRVRVDRHVALRSEQLGIPVSVAFCYRDSAHDRLVACYPGPAGTVDAELHADAWQVLAAATPLAAELEPDVEALLVHAQRGGPRIACYLVPITAAFELTGRLRKSWRGFSGGAEADRELAAFFAQLDARGGSA